MMSPLLFDAPPNAIKAPSSAALFAESLVLAVDGARDRGLCALDMPQSACCWIVRVQVSHRIQWQVMGGASGVLASLQGMPGSCLA